MTLKTALLTAVTLVGMSASAYALPITGSFTITASGTPVNAGVTVNMSTGISFSGPVLSYTPTASGTVFASLPTCSGSCGSIKSIANFGSANIASLFSLTNGLSFDLSSITSIDRSNSSKLTIAGSGIYHLAGYDDTFGSFTVTTTGTTSTLSLAFNDSATTAIPEPATMALLGGSLAALGIVRRRRG